MYLSKKELQTIITALQYYSDYQSFKDNIDKDSDDKENEKKCNETLIKICKEWRNRK